MRRSIQTSLWSPDKSLSGLRAYTHAHNHRSAHTCATRTPQCKCNMRAYPLIIRLFRDRDWSINLFDSGRRRVTDPLSHRVRELCSGTKRSLVFKAFEAKKLHQNIIDEDLREPIFHVFNASITSGYPLYFTAPLLLWRWGRFSPAPLKSPLSNVFQMLTTFGYWRFVFKSSSLFTGWILNWSHKSDGVKVICLIGVVAVYSLNGLPRRITTCSRLIFVRPLFTTVPF